MVWMISTDEFPMESFHHVVNSSRLTVPFISVSISTNSSLSSASVMRTPSEVMAVLSSDFDSAPLPSFSQGLVYSTSLV